MAAAKDPFTVFMEFLWWLLEQNETFCALVPKRNRIKYVDTIDSNGNVTEYANRDPEKDSHQAADYPEVAIEWDEGETHQSCDSNAGKVRPHFRIIVHTGDRRLCWLKGGVYAGLNPVMWSIIEAVNKWESLKTKCSYKGEYFLKWVRMSEHIERMRPPWHLRHWAIMEPKEAKAPPNPQGWALAYQGEVEMWFGSTALPTA